MLKMEIDSGDLTGQLLKLTGFKRKAEKHMRQAANRGVRKMASEWRQVAPTLSGQYRGSIKGRVKKVSGLFVLGIAGTGVNNQGYPYPRLLEFSGKHRYRSTSRSGSRTRGQAKKAVDSTAKGIFEDLGRALDKLARDLIFK